MIKRKLRRWGYIACGLAIMITSMAIFAPRETKETVATTAEVPEPDPLIAFSTEQEQLRSLQLFQLNDIINSERSSQTLIDQAQTEKLHIVERMETEQLISGILRARGYKDAACAVSETYVNVLVRASQLTGTDAARITELIITQTSISGENIKIIPIN